MSSPTTQFPSNTETEPLTPIIVTPGHADDATEEAAKPVPATKPTLLQCIVGGAYLLNALITYISMTGLFGCTNVEVSNQFFTIITPPGWAFSIWGIIFIWELVGCAYAIIPKFNPMSLKIVDNTFTFWWALACALQCAWSVVFCFSVAAAAAILFSIFVCLVALQQTSLKKIAALPDDADKTKNTILLYLLLVAPFSLHLGWVTAASTLNVNLAVVNGVASPVWLVTVAICSVVWVTAMGWTFGATGLSYTSNSCDVAMAAGVIWALVAVSQHDTTKVINTTEGPMVFPTIVTTPLSYSCIFAALVIAAALVIRAKIVAVKFVLAKTDNGEQEDTEVQQV